MKKQGIGRRTLLKAGAAGLGSLALGRAGAAQGGAAGATRRGAPLMSDKELFDALDLTLPGLQAVRTAAAAGDMAAAKRALASYLRTREPIPWTVSSRVADRSTIPWRREAAENAEKARIQVVTIWHTFDGGNIDWFYNTTVASADLPDNNEWQWQLNRMHFWGDLGRAYQATGDERWAQAWVRQLRSWGEQAGAPPDKNFNGAGSVWRTIESGIRMSGIWSDSYLRFLPSPSVTDDDLALYLKLAVHHARHLRQNPTTGNWLTMEMSGLYSVGALFPELKDAKGWRTYAAERLYEETKTQFLPDGAQVELTPGYHNVALDNVLKIPRLAKLVGRLDELPADYLAGTERAFDFNLFLMTPDRDVPRFNDSWPVPIKRYMEQGAELFPRRTDYAWVGSDGKNGAPPATTSHAFPYAGYWVMRSGWERDACYLCFDAGPLGYGHVHQDKLNVVVWAYGREVLFDSGGGSYERSPFRAYATDTFGHNTILVDGKPQRRQTRDREKNVSRTPIDVGWRSDADRDYAEGVYAEGYGAEDARIATHTRRVTFLKTAVPGVPLFVVVDRLQPADGTAHSYQARWNLLTTETMKGATGTVATTDKDRPNLAVVPLLTDGVDVRAVSAQREPEILGWHVRKDMDPQYVPATTVLHTRQGAGLQRFMTLLVPLKPGQESPVASVNATAPGVVEVTVSGRQVRIEDAEKGLAVTTLPG